MLKGDGSESGKRISVNSVGFFSNSRSGNSNTNSSDDISVGGRAFDSVWASRPALAAVLPDRRCAGDPVTPTLYIEALQRLIASMSLGVIHNGGADVKFISNDSPSINSSQNSADSNTQEVNHSLTNEDISAVLSHALALVQETLSAKRSMFERGSRLAPFNSWQAGGDNEDLYAAALACLEAAAGAAKAYPVCDTGIASGDIGIAMKSPLEEARLVPDYNVGLELLALLRRNGANPSTAATVAALELATGAAAAAATIDTETTAKVPTNRDAFIAPPSERKPLSPTSTRLHDANFLFRMKVQIVIWQRLCFVQLRNTNKAYKTTK